MSKYTALQPKYDPLYCQQTFNTSTINNRSCRLGNFYDNNSSKNCGLSEYWINIPQEWENFCRIYAKNS